MSLLSKYNIAAPRYTSYPTVPYWDEKPSLDHWKESVKDAFLHSNNADGISLYIHLPYCESLCTYCACNTRITVNHKVEEPYIDALLKEWNLYLEVFGDTPRIKEIHLGGGTPTFFSPQHLRQLIEGILSNSAVCSDAEFSFEAHPGNTTRLHMQTLFDLGFKRVSFGIQDFDPVVQDLINRYQTFEEVKKVVEEAREIGYTSINFDLVYGLPGQKIQSIADTIDLVNKLRPERIAFYSYAHVPWIKPGQRKFTEKDLPLDEEKRALYDLGKEKFLENGYLEIGMDHFSLPADPLSKALLNGTLHRNFMGYTHNFTRLLVGLGASSISDSWNCFAQNLKTVEDYLGAVNKGILPVFKGHVLTDEDLVLRKHILNLMCRFETDWNNDAEQTAWLDEVSERLKEPEAEGLVEVERQHVRITETGRAYLRNICLCFDARYWRKKPVETIFSSTA